MTAPWKKCTHEFGVAALERGYNVVCYEGPGQSSVRRYQGLGFIHEWEEVVSPVLDYLKTVSCVDMQKIGLIGNSMAALLAARAAAFEHRIAALFCIDGLYDLNDTLVFSSNNQVLPFAAEGDKFSIQDIVQNPKIPTKLRWAVSHGLWAFKAATPEEFLEKASLWTLVGVIDKIQCPVFVGDADEDIFFKGQPEKMRDALGKKATYVKFTAEDGASAHCHYGALTLCNQVIYDWFEGIVGTLERLQTRI
jgi:pimeloyl-ACP methyl ester carboxylesterase